MPRCSQGHRLFRGERGSRTLKAQSSLGFKPSAVAGRLVSPIITVRLRGVAPLASASSEQRSPAELQPQGGGEQRLIPRASARWRCPLSLSSGRDRGDRTHRRSFVRATSPPGELIPSDRMVGEAGLEPATSRSRTARAARLRYTPSVFSLERLMGIEPT